MKKSLKVLSLVRVLVMAVLSLASCSKYNALKSAFEKEGYEENADLESMSQSIKEEMEKDDLAVNLHLLTKKGTLSSALIVEFKSTEDMKKAYDDSATIRGFIEDVSSNEDAKEFQKALEDTGYAKGNCLVLPLTLTRAKEIRDIVKSVK
ncbi:MAG TPA: hypothetical protein DDY70_03120 [Clostridiales bacterium]|nr:hypothetical protein [Clostridiales bacterium]